MLKFAYQLRWVNLRNILLITCQTGSEGGWAYN